MKTLKRNYEEFYEKVSIIPQQTDEEEIEFFANLVGSDEKLDILDLGCAEGKLVVNLALKGHNLTAADISNNYLKMTSKLALMNSVNVEVIRSDIEVGINEFKGKKFDLIFFMDVIEHLRCSAFALENIRKLMKDDGTLIIHTPNVVAPAHFVSYLIRRKKLINYYDAKNLGDLHFQLYDYRTLEKILNYSGLKVHEIVPTKISMGMSYLFRNKVSPTKLKLFDPFYRFLSRLFPFLSDNILVKCKKEEPINVEKQISFWQKTIK